MKGVFNDTFFKFVIGFFGIILASFCVTVALDYYDEQHPGKQAASVFESIFSSVDHE